MKKFIPSAGGMITCGYEDHNMCFSLIGRLFFLRFICLFLIYHTSFYANAIEPTIELNLQGQIPRVEFDSTRFDFGEIYRGQRVSHLYKFQNTGNGTLVFSSIHAACGCINTKMLANDGITVKNVFKSGESGLVNVEFNSRDFSGNIVRTITLETNMGSSSPTVTLTVTANVLQELTSNPALLYVGKIQGDSQKIFNINMNLIGRGKFYTAKENMNLIDLIKSEVENSKLSSQLKENILSNTEPLKVIAVESNVPFIKVKLLPQNSSQNTQLSVQIDDKSIPIGAISAKIKVWNNSTYYKDFEIPIIGEAVGHVQASAKYVEFGVVNEIRPAERVITFKSLDKNFSVTGVKVELKKLPELKNLKDSDLFDIRKDKLSLSNAASEGNAHSSFVVSFKLRYPKNLDNLSEFQVTPGVNVSGFFVVKTNDPDYKEITVPFFGVLRKEP
ncbi:DUF1573 domain-containing protein [Fluviispira multicolorata]|uniref:DUF1573 domain-containing protein n=1 Tax=Fluviispira multicolorata TaxID=2654512 RepID=A0A833N451_9BACT|nr:DUF1573 domain-containing protein [Fluviispira multicolorata]KAB8029911.1 DUF1573 domain-containing protein [Fluviispira multicolorata]